MQKRAGQLFSFDSVGVVSFIQEALRHIEGTIILHMRYSIMKDMELGREFIKLLKVRESHRFKKEIDEVAVHFVFPPWGKFRGKSAMFEHLR